MPEVTSVTCVLCGTVNGPTSKFRSKCGMALKVEDAVSVEEDRNEIAKKFMELIASKPEILQILKQL